MAYFQDCAQDRCSAEDPCLDCVRRTVDAHPVASWRAAPTSVSRLPLATRQIMRGFRPDLATLSHPFGSEASPSVPADSGVPNPPAVLSGAWSLMDLVGPIKDQGPFGTCVAFATAAVMEIAVALNAGGAGSNAPVDLGAVLQQTTADGLTLTLDAAGSARQLGVTSGTIPDLSEDHLYVLGGGHFTGGVADGWHFTGGGGSLDYAAASGTVSELICPYSQFPHHTALDSTALHIKIGTVYKLNQDVTTFKQALQALGAILFACTVYQDFDFYREGVYIHTTTSSPGGHAMAIVGFDDTLSAFLVRNQWGMGWGDAGYMWWDYSDLLSLTSEAYAVTIGSPPALLPATGVTLALVRPGGNPNNQPIFQLSWTPASPADVWMVQYGTDPTWTNSHWASIAANVATYNPSAALVGLIGDTAYARVYAADSAGNLSAPSATASLGPIKILRKQHGGLGLPPVLSFYQNDPPATMVITLDLTSPQTGADIDVDGAPDFGIAWSLSLSSDASGWATASATSGTTPETVTLTLDLAALAVGNHTLALTLNSSDPLCINMPISGTMQVHVLAQPAYTPAPIVPGPAIGPRTNPPVPPYPAPVRSPWTGPFRDANNVPYWWNAATQTKSYTNPFGMPPAPSFPPNQPPDPPEVTPPPPPAPWHPTPPAPPPNPSPPPAPPWHPTPPAPPPHPAPPPPAPFHPPPANTPTSFTDPKGLLWRRYIDPNGVPYWFCAQTQEKTYADPT